VQQRGDYYEGVGEGKGEVVGWLFGTSWVGVYETNSELAV
jgi:hypothetical protein